MEKKREKDTFECTMEHVTRINEHRPPKKDMKLLLNVMPHTNPRNSVFSANTAICSSVYSFR